jgi:predicted dienelactone hydrolase
MLRTLRRHPLLVGTAEVLVDAVRYVDRRIAADHAREQELGLSFGQKAQEQATDSAESAVDGSDPASMATTEENAA